MKTINISQDFSQKDVSFRHVTVHDQLEDGRIMLVQGEDIVHMSTLQFRTILYQMGIIDSVSD